MGSPQHEVMIRVCIFVLVVQIPLFGEGPNLDHEFGRRLKREVSMMQRELVEERICLSHEVIVGFHGEIGYRHSEESTVEGDRPIAKETLFPIWSMSKPVTSVAAMLLYEQGAFALDDSVHGVLPKLSRFRVQREGGATEPLRREITYRDLLCHTAGIDGYDGSFDQQGTWKQIMELNDLDEVMTLLVSQALKHQPGEGYTYGMNTAVLGRAVEVLSGMPFADFLRKKIFSPLGMTQTRFSLTKEDRAHFQPLFVKEGNQYRPGTVAEDELYYRPGSALSLGGEGLVSSMTDYAKFCQMLVDQGRPILKKKTLSLMLDDHLKKNPHYGGKARGLHHGLGFWVLEDSAKEGSNSPNGIFGWSGYHTTHFWVDPQHKLYGIFMTRRYPSTDVPQRRLRDAVYRALKP